MLEKGENLVSRMKCSNQLQTCESLAHFLGLLAEEYENIILTFFDKTKLSEWEARATRVSKNQLRAAHARRGVSSLKPSNPDRNSSRPPQELSFSGILMREGGRTPADTDKG